MTTYGLAVAVCGTTQACECKGHQTPETGVVMDHPAWEYLLDDRARKPCDYMAQLDAMGLMVSWRHDKLCPACKGLNWVPAILLPEEPCRDCNGMVAAREGAGGEWQGRCATCDGSGTIQREDEGLMRELLEEAGCTVIYSTAFESVYRWSVLSGDESHADFGPTLLEAAARAMSVEVQI